METTQAERMMRTLDITELDLNLDILTEKPDISRPIQDLFDECLNFISVTDFNL